jgi:flagellar biogenesis protein FliO
MKLVCAALAVALAGLAAPAAAQAPAEAPRERIPFKQDDGEFGALMLRVVIAFSALALLGGGVIYILKRRGYVTLPGAEGPRPLRLVQSMRLGPRTGLLVVEFGENRVLLSQGESGATLISSERIAPAVPAQPPE